jgi:uncharacterized membrane protein (DUF2068 family)
MQWIKTIRVVAVFEATKGILVLLAGIGVLTLIHQDIQLFADRLIEHLHLNPAKHYPRIFLNLSAHITVGRLWVLAALAASYALLRFIEAFGLWHGRRWAEWFAAVSGGIYIPFELLELFHTLNWLAAGMLLANAGVVAFMITSLLREKKTNAAALGRESRLQ